MESYQRFLRMWSAPAPAPAAAASASPAPGSTGGRSTADDAAFAGCMCQVSIANARPAARSANGMLQ